MEGGHEINKSDGVLRNLVGVKSKGPWEYKPSYLSGETISIGGVGGFPWPPRSYTCSFCKRQFRSAQALGGHMNVHRRDRARLKQSPPWVPQASTNNPDTITNSIISSTSNPTPMLPPFTSPLPPLRSLSRPCFPPPLPSTATKSKISELATSLADPSCTTGEGCMRRKQSSDELFHVGGLKDFVVGVECADTIKRRDFLSLDLEIGLHGESKDDLDLELRLGYA